MPTLRPLAGALLAGALVIACAEAPVTPGILSGPVTLDIVSGDGQVGVAGAELPATLKVQARAGSKKLPGLLVSFRITTGSGRMFVGASITDRDGYAQDYWTLGNEIGTVQRVEVVAVDPTSGAKQNFGTFTARGAATAAPKLEATPTTVDFGTATIGSPTASSTLTVTNMGVAGASGIAVALGGAGAPSFEVTSDSCTGATVAFAQSCAIGVRFNPLTEGALTATLTVTPSAGSATSVALQGGGVGTPNLSITPVSFDFGTVSVGTSSATQAFVVANAGNGATGILSTQLAGAAPSQFPLVMNQCQGISLAPAASCTVTVRFQPTSGGARTATLDVSGTPGGNLSAALTGTGQVPAQLAIGPTSQFFGYVSPGSPGSLETFTVSNVGATTSGVIGFGFGSGGNFSVQSTTCATLAPAASCQVVVKFLPLTTGNVGTILIASASPGGSVTASLTGTGTPPVLVASPPTLNFGSIAVGGASAYQTVGITHNGGIPMPTGTLSTSIAGTNPGDFTIGANTCSGANLNPGQSCSLQVRFQPGASGARSAQLQVHGADGPSVAVALTGSGALVAVLSLSPTAHDFGLVPAGSTTPAQLFTMTNIGNATSGTITAGLTGSGAAEFVRGGDSCNGQTLAPGATCQVSVSFQPGGAGSFSAALQLSANTGGTVTAALTGSASGPSLALTPASYNFGTVPVGAASSAVTFTLSNNGSATSGTLNAAITGANAAAFGIVSSTCAGTTLAVGATCTVDVMFAPGATGTMGANLVVSGSTGESTSAALAGTGGSNAPVIVINPTSATMSTFVGQTTSATFNVSNTGGTSTSLGFSITGANPSAFGISGGTCGPPLAPGASCSVTVTFAPSAPTTFTAQLNVLSAAPTVVAQLTGTGR